VAAACGYFELFLFSIHGLRVVDPFWLKSGVQTGVFAEFVSG